MLARFIAFTDHLVFVQIMWEHGKARPGFLRFYASVDGTVCPINEPKPFDTIWFSHKLIGAGVCYKIGESP